MTLQQCKDQVAQKYGYKEWNEAIIKAPSVAVRMADEYSTLYATEKVEEALKLAASRLPSKDTGRAGCSYNDTEFDSESVVYGYNMAIDYCGEKILSLEAELINQINKEI